MSFPSFKVPAKPVASVLVSSVVTFVRIKFLPVLFVRDDSLQVNCLVSILYSIFMFPAETCESSAFAHSVSKSGVRNHLKKKWLFLKIM